MKEDETKKEFEERVSNDLDKILKAVNLDKDIEHGVSDISLYVDGGHD